MSTKDLVDRKRGRNEERLNADDGMEFRLRGGDGDDDNDDEEAEFCFSQQAPELSQPIPPVKPSERSNLESMNEQNKKKVIMDLSRMLLFKGLAGEPIDRVKCIKEASLTTNDRIASALMEAAATNLRNVFGFEIRRVPKFMEKMIGTGKPLSKKYTDRLYIINEVTDESGDHSRAIHSYHNENAIEKGFLMLVLAFIFCKGDSRSDGSRWISDLDLYRLLHGVDESFPEDPSRYKPASSTTVMTTGARAPTVINGTPNVDAMLEKFTYMDYLIKQRVDPENGTGTQVSLSQATTTTTGEEVILYAMGPRAAMEVGRHQVISFCADTLHEQPDPTMLAEIAMDEEEYSQDAEIDMAQ